ncbi:transferrin-like isoform X2 [Choristoneura fumiferana]|uniref:transferrin-like isoform X2 n=1 Tax=Choristoneura fumiferana TaxID=7141 RepID=UPI003D1594A3
MALKFTFLLSVVLACVAAQSTSYRVCVSSSSTSQCQSLDRDDSQAFCTSVESRVDCALQLARGTVDIGYFTEEELLVLADLQSTDHRVVATIRDSTRQDPVSFEAVAVVPNSHSGGLQALRGGKYCHPGLGEPTLRWSPRVEKALEVAAAGTDRCPDADINHKTAEEMEASTLSQFFGESCRPGAWSANATHDAELKRQFPNLCALCGPNSQCDYTIEMGVNIAGVNNNNAHIKALECLRTGGSVAYVAWQHAKEFFITRNPEAAGNFSILCPDNSQVALTAANLNLNTAPCAFVRQPWSAIVASTARATEVQASLRAWWPTLVSPNDGSWRSTLYSILVPTWSNARVNFEDTLLSPANYTGPIRTVPSSHSATSCIPARNWCTVSEREFLKCQWVRSAAYTLGIQPTIACQQRNNYFECLRGVRDRQVDFLATPANYGYLARQNYRLAPVKLMQNQRTNEKSFSRVTALLRNSTATSEVTRFENLKGKKACFPEFGGISYVSFVRTAQQIGVLSASECDYAKAVGEFFEGACAPGALDATHALSETNYDATPLCTACRSANVTTNFTCDWNYNDNLYFGNNGSLACLADNEVHVAFVETQNLAAHLTQLNLDGNQFRALCKNNSLAINNGIAAIDDNCLLSYVVDSEVLTRRGTFVRPAVPGKPKNNTHTKPPPRRPVFVYVFNIRDKRIGKTNTFLTF